MKNDQPIQRETNHIVRGTPQPSTLNQSHEPYNKLFVGEDDASNLQTESQRLNSAD